ncbi:hypothetical protein Y032_0102g3462 [Ancylostoma ceylanicum]|uniref:Potassium channel domain-containing protein n=1 Tax=Ancylostoma ceylanicum TaxID=53326 RepID=A0A016TGL3_9BILA|nr:hypothetical protein Y032_0102g3462 [Ancylostoma ceylanicum]
MGHYLSYAPVTLLGIREEDDELDSGFHTYTSRDRNSLYRSSMEPARKFSKYRSHSFSGVPKRKISPFAGSAKIRAIYSRNNSVREKNVQKKSAPQSQSADELKAVRDYYDRHPLSLSNEKNCDSFYTFRDVTQKDTGSMYDPADIGPNIPTTRKFHNSIYWILHNRSQYGFRHICMLFLVLVYTLLGAALFFSIESRHERKTVAIREVALDAKVAVIAEQLRKFYNNTDAVLDIRLLEKFVKHSYISLLKEESLYTGSTYYKTEDPANFKWTYPSAIFFSMNVYTTTGYGSIAPDSMLGRFCVICYSLITVPVTLVVIRDLGQWTLVILTKGYAHLLVAIRRSMGYSEPHEDTMIALPMKFCLTLLAGYTFFSATFIYVFDEWYGDMPNTGLPFFTSFYFSYISITTIGLGDIMPNNATFHPIISTLFFFGLPIMKVVNRATYVCIENGVFGGFNFLLNKKGLRNKDSLLLRCVYLTRELYRSGNFKAPTQVGGGLYHGISKNEKLTECVIFQPERPPRRTISRVSRCSYCSHISLEPEENKANELLNNLTIRSLATFARANADVYGGGFGRVNLRKGDLVQSRANVNQGPS